MTIAARTFVELQNEVLSFQFEDGKYRPYVKKWLNEAQRIVARQAEIRTQQGTAAYTTESGVSELELPEDFARFISFTDTNADSQLAQVDIREFDSLAASSGRPTAYAVSAGDLLVYPAPDGAYPLQLRYWKLPQDMVEDSDKPSIPVLYHSNLTAYPMQKAYARENDYEASAFWKGEWEAFLAKMRGEVQSDAFDGPRQVSGSWGETPVIEWR